MWDRWRFQNLLTSLCPCGVTTITLWATSCHTRQPRPCTRTPLLDTSRLQRQSWHLMNRKVIKKMSICCNYNTSIAWNYMNTYSENMAQRHWLLCCNTNTGVMFKKICTITTCYVLLYTRTCHYEDIMSVLEQQVQAMLETSKSKQHILTD